MLLSEVFVARLLVPPVELLSGCPLAELAERIVSARRLASALLPTAR